MSVTDYGGLRKHIGHEIECVCYAPEYGYEGDPANVSVECMTCMEVIMSFDKEVIMSFDKEEDDE